jgi:hypothetical protein
MLFTVAKRGIAVHKNFDFRLISTLENAQDENASPERNSFEAGLS